MRLNQIQNSDALAFLKELPDESVDTCITSPPYYGLRDYGHNGQIGLEATPFDYVEKLVDLFGEVRRVLKPTGSLWLNLGDSYAAHKDCKSISQTIAKGTSREIAHEIEKGKSRTRDSKMLKSMGFKNKDLMGIPWRVAFALQDDGWYLRQDIIWDKPNPMPESVQDRCTKSHEYIFLLTKQENYYFDSKAIQELATGYDGRKKLIKNGSPKYATSLVPGQSVQSFAIKEVERWKTNEEGDFVRNKRSVWHVATKPFRDAHFATFPEELIIPCVRAGSPERGVVLDPFMGAGTTALVAHKLGRDFVGCEINPEYMAIANKRLDPHLRQLKLF